MGDIENRGALVLELAQRGEEGLDLLRGQNAGGLIHDQQLRVLQEAANDLHSLTLTR